MPTTETYTVTRRSLEQSEVAPVHTRLIEDETLFIDFGQAAFGTLIIPNNGQRESLVVHLGEQVTSEGRIERQPAGTIRYIRLEQTQKPQQERIRILIPSDPRNTGPMAICMPPEIGEVFPFRYAEIEGAANLDPNACRQLRVHYPFNDDAAAFSSSDEVLNAVWELCKYSIKATSFCGVYVDGDRERIPYEGDAYINQLCHYGVDGEYALARYTHEYLLHYPTWPTEWQLHSVMMAWMDYLYTGESRSLEVFYETLCAKTLIALARADGLISTASERCTRAFEERLGLWHAKYIYDHGLRDLVDWPPGSFTGGGQGERDKHEMLPVNTVVNAFHYHALTLMANIAAVLGQADDRARFAGQAKRVETAINTRLFNADRGIYVDGEGSRHASLHSNMTALAFGLVPAERRDSVIAFVKSRGMACSVYGAQYLLEALYLWGEDHYALGLMTAQHDRSWWHMRKLGSTITLEAWDLKYKNNLDWNHAWGAVPANIIPRFVLGVRPLEPGFRKILIRPQPGALEQVAGTVPTPLGPVQVVLKTRQSRRELQVSVPQSATAVVGLRVFGDHTRVFLNGHETTAQLEDGYQLLEIGAGPHTIVFDEQS